MITSAPTPPFGEGAGNSAVPPEFGVAKESYKSVSERSEPAWTFAIVDDHKGMVHVVASALEANLKVKCTARCATVKDAKARLIEVRPHVVMLDWRLADGCGDEIIRHCAPSLPDTRWLLFTGVPTVTVLREAVAAGIHGGLSKAVEFPELVHAMTELLAGRLYYCSACMTAIMKAWQAGGSPGQLTNTERDVLRCVSRGLEAKAIAVELGLSVKTVHNTLAFIRAKCGVGSLVEMAKFAEREGLA